MPVVEQPSDPCAKINSLLKGVSHSDLILLRQKLPYTYSIRCMSGEQIPIDAFMMTTVGFIKSELQKIPTYKNMIIYKFGMEDLLEDYIVIAYTDQLFGLIPLIPLIPLQSSSIMRHGPKLRQLVIRMELKRYLRRKNMSGIR